MPPEQAAEQMRRRLLDLQAALFDLRDELCNMSLTLQEHTSQGIPGSARAEASELFKRLRG